MDRPQGWTGDYVRTLAEGTGKLFVTSFNGKVFQVTEQRFQEMPKPPGLPGRGYQGHVDETGRLWLVQPRFFGFWDGRQWRQARPTDWVNEENVGAGSARDAGCGSSTKVT